jgi:hypothetical protein
MGKGNTEMGEKVGTKVLRAQWGMDHGAEEKTWPKER